MEQDPVWQLLLIITRSPQLSSKRLRYSYFVLFSYYGNIILAWGNNILEQFSGILWKAHQFHYMNQCANWRAYKRAHTKHVVKYRNVSHFTKKLVLLASFESYIRIYSIRNSLSPLGLGKLAHLCTVSDPSSGWNPVPSGTSSRWHIYYCHPWIRWEPYTKVTFENLHYVSCLFLDVFYMTNEKTLRIWLRILSCLLN